MLRSAGADSQKVLSAVFLYSKCTRALTFENVCYALQLLSTPLAEIEKEVAGSGDGAGAGAGGRVGELLDLMGAQVDYFFCLSLPEL